MKHNIHIFIIVASALFSLASCEEDITIDTEKGAHKIGIYGYITTDEERHSITISRTADFYSKEEIEMISDAQVSIIDLTTTDTILLEETEKGIYQTYPIAGTIGHSYRLEVTLTDQGETQHYFAESYIDTCPGKIDSIQIHKYTFFDEVIDDVYKVCPFFQTTKKDIYYLFDLNINGTSLSDTLSQKAKEHLGPLSGLYYNGKEMEFIFKDLNTYPLGIFYLDQTLIATEQKLDLGDTLELTIRSIPKGYYHYLSDISNSIGSNPLMGSPTNVRTNIKGKEKEAVGYFHAASCIHYTEIISKLPDEQDETK